MEETRQKALEEFFDLVKKPMWQSILHNMLQRYGMQVWDIDVSILMDKLLEDAYKQENLKNASLIVLICTILLKSKARRIGLSELEQTIKDELKELENAQEENPLDAISNNDLERYNELLELEAKLKNLFERKERNLSDSDKKKFQYLIRIESYFQLKNKLLNFFAQNSETTYSELMSKVQTNNSIIMGLLLLNNENKISLKQKKPYEDFIIKRIDEKH